MATLTIRRLEDGVKSRLRIRAASHGRSMEEEAREILKSALNREPVPGLNLADSIRRHLAETGGFLLELPPREPIRDPPDFTK
jgi:plasmid stability protein